MAPDDAQYRFAVPAGSPFRLTADQVAEWFCDLPNARLWWTEPGNLCRGRRQGCLEALAHFLKTGERPDDLNSPEGYVVWKFEADRVDTWFTKEASNAG